MEPTIRRATQDDMDRLFALWCQLQYSHVDYHPAYYPMAAPDVVERAARDFLGGLADNPDVCFVVAICDGLIVGYGIAEIRIKPPVFLPVKELMIQEMVVDVAYRKQGVFSALHRHLVAWGRERGATLAVLMVDTRNPAVEAYRHMGYEAVHLKMVAELSEETG